MTEPPLYSSFARATLLVLSLTLLPAFAQDKAKPAAKPAQKGLRGLLALEVPLEFTADSLEDLGGQWAPVREKLAALMTRLYEDESLNILGQRKVLEDLKSQLKLLRMGIEEPRNKPIQRSLVRVHGQLARRIGVAEALLDAVTISTRPAPKPSNDVERQQLADATRKLEAYFKTFSTGATWASYLRISQVGLALGKSQPSDNDLALLSGVQKKLRNKDQLKNKSQAAVLKEKPVAAFERALDAWLVKVANPPKPRRVPAKPVTAEMRRRLRPHLATLSEAIDDYEQSASRLASTRVRQSLKAVQDASPAQGEQLGEALREHYLSYNLRLVASEAFLARYIGQTRIKKKPVKDVILDAQVTGDSTTTVKVGINLLPGNDGARWEMLLTGKTITDTRAVKRGVQIFTHGEHTFTATKLVLFDGDRFVSKPAVISVDANNTVVDIKAKSSFVRRIAQKKTRKLHARTEEIASEKVAADVGPEFNGEVDKQFQKATRDLADHVNGPLKELDLFPSARSITSTNDALLVSTRLMGSGELAGSRPNPAVTSKKGLVLHLHESAINNALDRLKLAGRTMTEEDLKQEIEKTISTFLGRDFRFAESEAKAANETGPATLIFAAADPLRVRIAGGNLVLIIRAGLKGDAGKEDIPPQVITVPFGIRIEGDDIRVSRGSVKVSAVSRAKSRAKQIIRAGVVRKKLTGSLKDRSVDRHTTVAREGAEALGLSVTRIEAADGWLSVVFE